jgi:hypothetical protein
MHVSLGISVSFSSALTLLVNQAEKEIFWRYIQLEDDFLKATNHLLRPYLS